MSIVPGNAVVFPTVTTTQEQVDGVFAAEGLAMNSPMNRKLRLLLAQKYAAQMVANHWVLNGETITFDKYGRLVDGQHRLKAVLLSGVTVPMLVVRGVEPKVYPTINTGRGRLPADVLNTKAAGNKASIVRLVRVMDLGQDPRKTIPRDQVDRLTLVELWEDDGWDAEVDAVYGLADVISRSSITSNRCAWGSLLVQANRINPALADQFYTGVRYGTNLNAGDPRLALRIWMGNKQGVKVAPPHLGTYVKVWNDWMNGTVRKQVKTIDNNEAFPKMVTTWQPARTY